MPNANTIMRLVGAPTPAQGTVAVPALSLANNTETLFVDQTGGTALLFTPGGTLASGTTGATSFGVNQDGFPFRVRAAFKATTGGSSTAIISIYAGSTIVSGNKLGTVTSQSLATTSTSGFLILDLIWSNIDQKLVGTQSGIFGSGSAVSFAALTNTGVAVTSLANMKFCISANLGSSVTATFVLTEFCIEAV
jgi:hypothetical protein